jgi:hypothetical protein
MLVQNLFGAPYIPKPKGRGFTANRIKICGFYGFYDHVMPLCKPNR